MSAPQPGKSDRVLLLGEAESRYGAFRLETLPSGRVACTLSVGSDPASPALAHKGQPDVPNEDALFVLETGARVLLAVADAHYGAFASHAILRRLSETLAEVPLSPANLLRALQGSAAAEPGIRRESATTLLAAIYRAELGAGFGFSFGDSSCILVGPAIGARRLNRSTGAYVRPDDPRTLSPDRAAFFEFEAGPGNLLLAFTDGIDACHYRHPETSLGPRQFLEVLHEAGARPDAYVRRLTEWALSGCDGNPGGQDNLALVAVST